MPRQSARIEDYGFLSDTQSDALVSRDGCVDWLCLPRFDSPACFASLLGEAKNGHWRFFPDDEDVQFERRYRGAVVADSRQTHVALADVKDGDGFGACFAHPRTTTQSRRFAQLKYHGVVLRFARDKRPMERRRC